MSPLADRLRTCIQANGPMPLADYMQAALQDPEHGYYITRDPLGADFTTAPEISQMFGELLGLALAQTWIDQGRPAPFVLAELGPGRGTLMADMLRATQAVSGFHTAAQIVLVETSDTLRAQQAQNVPGAVWVASIDDLPAGPLFLVANEFFDALPVHQFQRQGQAWREKLVGVHQDRFVFGWSEPIRQKALAARLADTADGAIVELCPAAEQIAAGIAARIADHGGAAIWIDYGDWQSLGDTVQALKAGLPVDPLQDTGNADITAHVDFAALSRAAATAAQVSPLVTQGVFLERLGITARAQALAKTMDANALDALIAAHRRLTHPDEMGHLFKVIGVVPTGQSMVPGLETAHYQNG